MFDFRYHALTLVAVFLALAIGLLLGVAIGDAGLVSSAERNIRDDLRGDVRGARAEAAELRGQLAERQRFERAAYPALVAGRLDGMRVGVIALGGLSDRLAGEIDEALEGTGARLRSVSVVRRPLDPDAVAGRAGGTRYEELPDQAELYEPLGERVAVQYVRTGRLLNRLRPALLSSYSGSFQGHDGVVLVRSPETLSGEEETRTADFERGLLRGLRRLDVPVVGVESTSARPSQVAWYKDQEVASVDNVDQVAGHAALVFALAGSEGHFGIKATADALLPKAIGPATP